MLQMGKKNSITKSSTFIVSSKVQWTMAQIFERKTTGIKILINVPVSQKTRNESLHFYGLPRSHYPTV